MNSIRVIKVATNSLRFLIITTALLILCQHETPYNLPAHSMMTENADPDNQTSIPQEVSKRRGRGLESGLRNQYEGGRGGDEARRSNTWRTG